VSVTTVGFAGLTHLGINSAAAAAERGFAVVAFDPDAVVIARLDAGDPVVSEPGLSEMLAQHRERMQFSADPAELGRCDVVYIACDVPTDEQGASDLSPVNALIALVCAGLRADAVLVILCQVPPGFTRALAWPAAQRYYQVETLIFGRAVERATRPERLIIGCGDPLRELPPAYRGLLESFNCPILPMRYESAELSKIAINCCLVASVTVANTLAELSERIGADWHEIVPALKLDRRIGAYAYLAPGLGLAGGNLERDLATVERMAVETGSESGLMRAFVGNSRHRRDWVLRLLHRELLCAGAACTLAVLGLSYKENTHSTKNSPALALLGHLHPWPVRVHDPVVPASAVVHPRVTACASALAAADGADALVIMTPWPEYRQLVPDELARVMRGRLVIDPYGLLDGRVAVAAGLIHHTLGRPQAAATEPHHA